MTVSKWGAFWIGAATGVVAYSLVRSPAFKRACASVMVTGVQLKNDAAAFCESVKEDAQDIAAEHQYKANKGEKA